MQYQSWTKLSPGSRSFWGAALGSCLWLGLSGCGGGSPAPEPTSGSTSGEHSGTSHSPDTPATPVVSRVDDPAANVPSPLSSSPPGIPSISLGGAASGTATASTGGTQESELSDQSRRALLEAMKPLQIMLGSWRGTTQKEVGDFKALDTPEWVWDFQTDRNQPAMVMKSEASAYLRSMRLTYLPDSGLFKMTATDADGKVREFEGKFTAPAEEFQGDDQKMHVKYKLELKQTNGESPRDTWQVTFNQQENHRYLVELARRSGSNFIRFDTIANQRAGTSFAKSDDDYGERECIISGGLGTMQVSYKGKSYWVCCTGCKAAFDEDPVSWIAEFEAKKAAKAGS